MKTVFILNPKAGQGGNTDAIVKEIQSAAKELGADIHIYITKAVHDAERFVKEWCETNGAARFIARGGDGTLSEVLNGAIGCPETEIGVIPAGTGNDFCRNFGNREAFSDVVAQLQGTAVSCDAIHFCTEVAGEEKSGYGVNMFNIGFDCNVADMVSAMKRKPFVSGSLAYVLSIFVNLIQKKGTNLKVEADGELIHEGALLLNSVANGCYCGGGIKSNPMASVSDGTMNINVIKNITRRRFMGLLPHYMKGTHLQLPNIEEVITTRSCKTLTVTPLSGNIRISCDGEIIDAGKTVFSIVPGAFRFVVPAREK